MMKTRSDKFFNLSRAGTLIAFALAIFAAILAPISALRWAARPFPGFMAEQTLVISTTSGIGWTGLARGLHYPLRVTHLNGLPIQDGKDYAGFFITAKLGDAISVDTSDPQGKTGHFDGIELIRFPLDDFLRLFWLSYAIGLFYLTLGIWVYRLRGNTAAGRAFAYFAACAAIVNALTFNVWTSHDGAILWTLAVAQLGGAMIGLSVLFPVEKLSATQRGWVRGLAYTVSFTIASVGLILLSDMLHPWAYIRIWLYSYIYAAVGIFVFITSLVLRLRASLSPLERQQVRIILWGAVIAFAPIGIWFGLQAFVSTPFNPLILSTLLLIFPLSIAIGMVRYHLWDIKLVFRRTIIYSFLTLLLIGIYFVIVLVFDLIFSRYIKESNVISVAATIVIVLIFTPLRRVVQRFVDRQIYRNWYIKDARVKAFSNRLRTQVNPDHLNQELTNAIQETVDPEFIIWWTPKINHEKGKQDV